MQGKTDQGVVEFGTSGQAADVDIFHPVIQDFAGNATEVVEGPDMAIQKRRQIAVPDQFGINFSRVAQDHRKQESFLDASIGTGDLELGEIDLGLVTGLGFKSACRATC